MKKITFFIILLQSVFFYSQTLEGTWKLSPQPGAFAVGPAQGNYGWYTSTAGDVTTRACLFDDEYVFSSNGSFQNILGAQTWLEGWQGVTPDACGSPVAPHNGSGSATYTYDNVAGTLTLNGQGAFMGLAKAINGAELTTPNNAPTSVTYIVSSLSTTQLELVIHSGSGPDTAWWRFTFVKNGAPTCNDGIQNGSETGVDCGGTCQACVVPPPTVAAPNPPARAAADVKSIFSDAYTNEVVIAWGADWGPFSARINDISIAGNPTKIIDIASGKTFAGNVLGNYHDLSSFTHFHMDYWIPSPILTGQVLSIKLSNHAAQAGETSGIETLPAVQVGQWVSVDVPLADFLAASTPPNFSRSSIKEFAFTAARANNQQALSIYVDNIYFHKNTTMSTDSFTASKVKLYPNPTSNVLNIESIGTIQTISVYNVLGQEVINKALNSTSTSLDVSSLNSGIYVVKTVVDGVTSSTKFIKQ